MIMKKIFILISLAATVLFSCAKPELETPVTEELNYNTVITADVPQTKVAIDAEYTKLSWSNGDQISVLTSAGVYKTFTYTGEDGATTAEFKGTLDGGETVAGYAIYPANELHSVADGQPVINLPADYAWKEGQVMGPMVAVISEGEATFTHAAGLFAFDVQSIPAGTKGFRFSVADKGMTGSFSYVDSKITVGDSSEGSDVTMSFEASSEVRDMKFFIPAPTGVYNGFSIYYINSEDQEVHIKSAVSENTIAAATVKKFSVTIEGGAYFVTESGSSTASGLSWSNATTLSNALSEAEDGDVIYVGAGTYVPDTFISGKVATEAEDGTVTIASEISTATGDSQKAFIVDKNVTILGGYPAEGGSSCDPATNVTTLSGNDVTNHVVLVCAEKVSGKSVKMSGFTVTGAASNKTDDLAKWQINSCLLDDYSGALAVVGSDLELKDMVFTGNNTVNAAGIYGAESTAVISDCTFKENVASGNGIVWFNAGSNLTFSDSEISSNTAANASALYLYLDSETEMLANVSNVTITNNTSSSRGAVYLRTATAGQTLNATLDGCTITGNTAPNGAGVYFLNASGCIIKNCNISSNKGTGTAEGGVLYSLDACATYMNCTFSSNTATKNGTFLVQSNAIETTNLFDGCKWIENECEGFANMYVYGKATNNNVVITNSLFNGNSVVGRGGAVYARATGAGKVDCKCVNTTFYANEATGAGTAVLSYSNNNSYITNVDLISCTLTKNSLSQSRYAAYAETASGKGSANLNLYNCIVTNNGSNGAYDVGKLNQGTNTLAATLLTKYHYDSDSQRTDFSEGEYYDYTSLLGTLNSDGVCPLLLPDSNLAVTGGMTSAELSALASDNVPASVLTVDQLGNSRTGKVIGAWAGITASTDL